MHGELGAALDTGRGVADHPVELLAQFLHDPGDARIGQGVLVTGLRSRQQVQALDPLVLDQRLRQLGVAVDHVDQIVDDPALGAHDQVEVAQADVEIDDAHALATLREGRSEGRGRRRLADAALARCDDENLCHASLSLNPA